MACSFEDLALLHMVHELRPATEIDLPRHRRATSPRPSNSPTRIEREWSLNLTRTTPGPDADDWPCGTERCCELRKVEPLEPRASTGRAAWITVGQARRRADAAPR